MLKHIERRGAGKTNGDGKVFFCFSYDGKLLSNKSEWKEVETSDDLMTLYEIQDKFERAIAHFEDLSLLSVVQVPVFFFAANETEVDKGIYQLLSRYINSSSFSKLGQKGRKFFETMGIKPDGLHMHSNWGQRYSTVLSELTYLPMREVFAPFEVGGDNFAANAAIRYDPDLASGSYATVIAVPITDGQFRDLLPELNYVPIVGNRMSPEDRLIEDWPHGREDIVQVRRLTYRNDADNELRFVFHSMHEFPSLVEEGYTFYMSFPRRDAWQTPNLGVIAYGHAPEP